MSGLAPRGFLDARSRKDLTELARNRSAAHLFGAARERRWCCWTAA